MGFEKLWNCGESFYSNCKYPVLQRVVDCIKIEYEAFVGKREGLRNDRDLPLQQRVTGYWFSSEDFI